MKKNYLLFLLGSLIIIFGSNIFIAPDSNEEKRIDQSTKIESSQEFEVSDNPVTVSDEISDVNDVFQTPSINFSTPMFDGKISKFGGYIFDVKLNNSKSVNFQKTLAKKTQFQNCLNF